MSSLLEAILEAPVDTWPSLLLTLPRMLRTYSSQVMVIDCSAEVDWEWCGCRSWAPWATSSSL